jgi:hypothetical protein
MEREQYRPRVSSVVRSVFHPAVSLMAPCLTCCLSRRAYQQQVAIFTSAISISLCSHQPGNFVFPCLQWREGPSRGYDYHDRQVARERNEFPAAKRGRREGSPAYPSYREVSPAPGPMFPTAPRDRYESRVTTQKCLWPCLLKVLVFNLVTSESFVVLTAYPPPGVARGQGMAGRGYGRMVSNKSHAATRNNMQSCFVTKMQI